MIVSFLLLSSGQWLVGSLCPLWEHAGQSELFEILRVTKNCGYYAGPVAQPSLGAQWRTGGGERICPKYPGRRSENQRYVATLQHISSQDIGEDLTRISVTPSVLNRDPSRG